MSDAGKPESSGAAPARKPERRVFPRPKPPVEEVIVPQEVQLLQQVVQQVKKERAFFQAVLQQMPAGVLIATAPEGRLIMGNDRVEEILGRPFVPSQSFAEYGQLQGFHLDGRPYRAEEWPIARSLKRGENVAGERMKFLRKDGTWSHVSCNAAPVRDEDGKIIASVMAVYEIPRQSEKVRAPRPRTA